MIPFLRGSLWNPQALTKPDSVRNMHQHRVCTVRVSIWVRSELSCRRLGRLWQFQNRIFAHFFMFFGHFVLILMHFNSFLSPLHTNPTWIIVRPGHITFHPTDPESGFIWKEPRRHLCGVRFAHMCVCENRSGVEVIKMIDLFHLFETLLLEFWSKSSKMIIFDHFWLFSLPGIVSPLNVNCNLREMYRVIPLCRASRHGIQEPLSPPAWPTDRSRLPRLVGTADRSGQRTYPAWLHKV